MQGTGWIRILTLGLVLAALTACGTLMGDGTRGPTSGGEASAAASGAADQGVTIPAKVTMLLPLSGKHAALGAAMQNAATMAFADHGYPAFELLFEDTGSSPAGAAQAAASAVQGRSHLVLGPIFADEAQAAGAVTSRAGIPQISFSTDMGAAAPGRFIMGVLPQDQAAAAATYAATHGLGTILVVAPRTTYGTVTVQAFSAAAQNKGITVLPPVFVPEGQTQIPSLSAALSAAPVQAVFMPMGPAQSAALLPGIRSVIGTPNVTVLGTALLDEPDTVRRYPALQGVLYATPAGPAHQYFTKTYADLYGGQPPRLASLAYDSVSLALVLGRGGFLTQNLAAKLTDPNGYTGVDGPFRFSAHGYAERHLDIMRLTPTGARVEQVAAPSFTP